MTNHQNCVLSDNDKRSARYFPSVESCNHIQFTTCLMRALRVTSGSNKLLKSKNYHITLSVY